MLDFCLYSKQFFHLVELFTKNLVLAEKKLSRSNVKKIGRISASYFIIFEISLAEKMPLLFTQSPSPERP